MKKILLILFLFPAIIFGQGRKQKKLLEARHKENQQVIADLKTLEGDLRNRLPAEGMLYYDSVLQYIGNQFKAEGIAPYHSDSYVHTTITNRGKLYDNTTILKVNDKELRSPGDFFPLPFSANKTVSGMPAMALRERGLPWFADMKDLGAGSRYDSLSYKIIAGEAGRAAAKGATALFVYNSTGDNIRYEAKDTTATAPIPVVYVTGTALAKYFADHADVLNIELNVLLKEKTDTVNYIAAFINNNAPATVHITTDLPVRRQNDTTGIHTVEPAVLIELAKKLVDAAAKSNNYLFTLHHPLYEKPLLDTAVNYQINLKTLNLSNTGKQVHVAGYQTSPAWRDILIPPADTALQIVNDSMYDLGAALVVRPAISFFNYGTPALQQGVGFEVGPPILKYLLRIIETADSKGKLTYTALVAAAPFIAKEPVIAPLPKVPTWGGAQTASTSVSFGIVPDKYAGQGIKIKAVTPKKTGAAIGLQPGDIIVQLGDYIIADFQNYLGALSHYRPGDRTVLKIKRGDESKSIAVVF